MKPYRQIFPDSDVPALILEVPQKSGRIPGGSYAFLECYCTRPGCDCRRVVFWGVDGKMRPKATVCLGFDGDGPFCGPYLDPCGYQAPYADELLDFCVHTLNSRPEWVARLERQYVEVRERVEGVPYAGRPFPEPGDRFFRAMTPPDLETALKESIRHGSGHCPASPPKGEAPAGMRRLLELSRLAGKGAATAIAVTLREELHRLLLTRPAAVEELAALLPEVYRAPGSQKDRAAALTLLHDTLEFYLVEMQGGRPGARQQLQRLQSALVLRLFRNEAPSELRLDVVDLLRESGLRPIPELQRMMAGEGAAPGEGEGIADLQGDPFIPALLRHFASSGLASPFVAVEEILDLYAASDPELVPGLTWELLTADSAMLREAGALLLFDPDTDLSRGVSRMLAAVEGESITPDTLRRLIIARNWFIEPVRGGIDQAVGNARKARVACAHLDPFERETVYACGPDGSGGERFQVLVSGVCGTACCSLSLLEGDGLAACSIEWLTKEKDAAACAARLRTGRGFLETSGDYLDLRVCHALARGSEKGRAPGHSLLRIAELLGRDRWKGAPLDAGRELGKLREEMELRHPALLEPGEQVASLAESGEWHRRRTLFPSWKEEGSVVARVVEACGATGRGVEAAVAALCDQVLELKRELFLERLVLETLRLRFAKEPPIPWQRLYHVAQAVADESIALKEIPLAVSIARHSFRAYRMQSKTGSCGGNRRD